MSGADSRVAQNETKEKGVLAAKQATRYLREARAAAIKTNFNAPEVDQKWRWARQTADEAKQAGLDSDIIDDLYCALAAIAGDVVADTGSAEGARCLINAENRLNERYGK